MTQHKQQPSRLSNSLQEERVIKVAEQLYQNRQTTNKTGSAQDDWYKAERICGSSFRSALFRINQPLILCEKQIIEPITRWTDNADIFRLIERISPAVEAIGVLAIPCVLFFASQSYQERVIAREKAYQEQVRRQDSERLQQQVLRDYFNQLSTLMLELDSDLNDPKNERIRTLTTAATLTVLREPGLDGYRKGQIIRYLSDMALINADEKSQIEALDRQEVTISLRNSSLSGANLRSADISNADLRNANLRNVNLDTARLINADLSGADLENGNLLFTNLEGANLRDAALGGAFLSNANLRNADLRGANLSLLPVRRISLQGDKFIYGESYEIVNLLDGEVVDTEASSGFDGEYVHYVKRITRLDDADLSGANLENALLYGVDLSQTRVKEITLLDSILCKTKLPPEMKLDQDRDCLKMERIIQSYDPSGEEIGWFPE